jgi:hypothetical protein
MRPESTELFPLTLSSAVVLDGVVCSKGSVVEVDEATAKDLLRRGKAEVATVENVKAPQAPATELEVAPPAAPAKPEEGAAAVVEAKPLELAELTKAELLEKAKELGLDVKASDSKAQLIATLEAAVK